MKKTVFAVVMAVSLLAGCSSGITKEQYESVSVEKESLEAALGDIQTKYDELEKSNAELESQYQELAEEMNWSQASFSGVSFEIPKNWELQQDDGRIRNYISDDGYGLMIIYVDLGTTTKEQLSENMQKEFLEMTRDTLVKNAAEVKSNEYVTISDNVLALRTEYVAKSDGGSGECIAYFFMTSRKTYVFTFITREGYPADESIILKVINSIK